MRITRGIGLAGAALLLTACSSINTNSDQVGLHYSAGALSDTTFDECVPRNKHNFDGPGDLHYVYPAGDRTYKFDDHARGAEQGHFSFVSADNVVMTTEGILNFAINDDCEILRQFHERIGLKYGADSEGVKRWTELLQDYLGVALNTAFVNVGHRYNWSDLYYDEAKRNEFRDAVIKELPDDVKSIAKGDYFGGFTMLVPQPQPPAALLNQIQEQQVQSERIDTINAQKAAQDAEIAQIQQLVAILGPQGYILYRNQVNCEQNADSCIPFLPLPADSSVNVTPGG